MNQFYSPPKLVKRLAILFLLLTGINHLSRAQAPTISYPSAAANLTRGYSQGNLTIKLVFNGVCTGTVRLGLPASVTYVPGTITKTSGTAGVSIAEASIADLSKPTFSISGVAAIGDEITFTVARRAGCGVLATAKDSVYFVAGAGCSDGSEVAGAVNTYNLIAPALSLTPPAALVGTVVGATTTRTTTITNGGNGSTDTVRFYVVYPSAGIVNTSGTNAITANAVSFTPSSTSGDTLFYKIYGATIFGGNSTFDNAETVTITEPIRVAKCNTTTTYAARWGRTATAICQTATATSSMTMATGVPNYSSIVGAYIGFVDKCTPFEYTMTMSNTGSGNPVAATMFDLRILQGQAGGGSSVAGFDTTVFNFSNIRIGTTSIPAANITWGGTGGTVMIIELNNLFSTDPDGAGTGLEDIDGDGFFDDLYPGRSVVLRVAVAVKCDIACNRDKNNSEIGAQLSYREMCAALRVTASKQSAGILYITETVFTGTAYVPANIIEGTPFRFQAKESHFQNSSFADGVNTRYKWKIALPPGMTVSGTGSPLYGATAATYTLVSGGASGVDTVEYTSTSSALNNYFINLVYACSGPPGPISIYYSLEKIANSSTGCTCQGKLICTTVSSTTVCIGAPCAAGPKNYVPIVKRASGSFGWTNYSMATRQVETSISAYDLSKALYLDTINIHCTALQSNAANNLHIELVLPKTSLAPTGLDKLTPIRAVSQFYRGGSLVSTCTTSTFSAAASTATDQAVDFDLSPCLSSLPGGSLLANDSIASVVTYVVATNDGLPTNDVQSGTSNIYYNINGTGGRDFCNTLVPEMYLTGLIRTNGSNSYAASGCTPSTLGVGTNYLGNRFNTAGLDFATEFRPAFYVDSIVTTIPSGYNLVSVGYQPQAGGLSLSLTPTSVTGNVYSYVNPGTGAWASARITVSNAYGLLVPITVVGNCATVNSEVINTKIYVRDYYYAYAGGATPAGLAREFTTGVGGAGKSQGIAYLTANKPDIQLANLTGTVQGTKPSHSWDVRISNTSLSTAPYTWFAIPTNPDITVTELKEISSGTVIAPISYSGGNWYQLSTAGVASAASKDYRITFSYSACTTDSIKLFGGWNCTAYPSDPSTYTCGKDSLFLKLNPLNSQVQLSVTRQPGGGSSIPLCTTDSTLLVLNSAQAANLVNPYVTFTPPAGFTLGSTIKVEYPLGSGDYQNATVSTLPGGVYKIDLSAHTGIGANGMLGTASANTILYPAGQDRQAKIKVDFTTDCAYTSGTSFTFFGFGSKPCADPAIDNGISATTSALNISGAAAAGGAGGTMSFGATTVSCGTATTLSLSTVPTGAPTQAGDTIIYTLPAGLVYAGGFTKGTNCATCDIVASAASNKVKIKLQTGVAATNTLAYSFDVAPNTAGCGVVNITSEFKRSISSLLCSGVPCSSSSVVIASGISPNITCEKPNLQISNAQLVDTNMWIMGYGYPNKVWLSYTNNGTQAYTGGVDSVEFFCGSSTTSFATRPLTKSLAIGASDSDSYTVFVTPGTCTIGELVTARIKGTTSAGTQQCICSEASYLMVGAPLPLDFLSMNSTVRDCAVSLDWTYNLSSNHQLNSFVVERSREGSAFAKVATLAPSAETYIDVTPNAGLWLYRIKAIGSDGKSAYSSSMKVNTSKCNGNTISVYPNPMAEVMQIVLQGTARESRYTLSDALGRQVQEGQLQSNSNNTVSVANLPAATYLLKVIVDGAVSTQQIHVIK